MIARIKSSWSIYKFGCFDGSAAYVYCYPQQRWEVSISDISDKVMLSRNGVTIEVPKAEFEKNWRVIDGKDN